MISIPTTAEQDIRLCSIRTTPNSTDTGIAGQMTGGPDGNGVVPVQRTRDYPVSWPYFNDELTLNANAPDQKANITTEKYILG